jgi:hypothetical protein
MEMEPRRVWVDQWQQECCGEPFAVGDTVEWNLEPMVEEVRAFHRAMLGDEVADQITDAEERHGPSDADDDSGLPLVRGIVRSIERVCYTQDPRYLASEDTGEDVPPAIVQGSLVIERLTYAEVWGEHQGYLVDLDVLR